ncbi:CRISPR-associated protein, Cse1 family [Haloechinothrix alba]|uniref:CRISPR-associated protein, Cse1 family n=1 Tax=Haloechinothrix alba TaxID=664784 RepID=A0A238ZK77_9PSEU|nr:type I-E CRISPR-associated protein Cse1/CasA [Haloechinothrix alba]SNR83777.1 CRISPR-associated protein, Cse1 family [Haloechinothrix alba]
MTNDGGFNLLYEPWIVVLDPRGTEQELSIVDVFEHAPLLRAVGGEVPTQSFAIIRLLLAFLHRALDGPEDESDWGRLWRDEDLPMDRIRAYAERVTHRFDLFDVDAPFFQVPGLCTEKGEESGLERLVADVPNGEPLFTTRSPASLSTIEPAEAARWLVHAHAFDPAGIKTGVVGDPTVQGGRSYGSSVGWSGQIGGVLPQGASLRETLLLNLVGRNVETYVRIGGPDDVPPWERDVDSAKWSDKRPPKGAIDLYTWQTRRVRLVGGRDGVTGVVLAKGDVIPPHNLHGVDPHAAWRYSKPQSKKLNQVVYMPRTHEPEQVVWRGIAAMLPSVSGRRGSGREASASLAPGVLQWIGELVREGELPDDYRPRVRAVGTRYGTQNAVYDEILDDVLPLSVALLRQDDPALGQVAEQAVIDSEEVARAVWRFAENLARAAGSEPQSGAGDAAREQLYAALDAPYRKWLATLGADSDVSSARTAWQYTVAGACWPVARELLRAAGPSAWRGRDVDGRLVNVARAESWLRADLRKKLPLAHPPREEATPDEVTLEGAS